MSKHKTKDKDGRLVLTEDRALPVTATETPMPPVKPPKKAEKPEETEKKK